MNEIKRKPGLDNLIGQTIEKVIFPQGGDEITFETSSHQYIYEAYGDCCSHSWIETIEDLDNLIGETVTKIDIKEISEEELDQDYLDIMSYDIYTRKGICKIDFRNSSNGYYGGNLELRSIIEIEKEFKK